MGKPKKWKRKGPKSTRRGCLMCKPHKHERVKGGWEGKDVDQRRFELKLRNDLNSI